MTSPRFGVPMSIILLVDDRQTDSVSRTCSPEMKSPISKVGIIDEGILNGSTMNRRSTKTIRITGKKPAPYSTHHDPCRPHARLLQQHESDRQMAPTPTTG